MTYLQCALVATIIIPIIYIYRFVQLYKQYFANYKKMTMLHLLSSINYCAVWHDDNKFSYSVTFAKEGVTEAGMVPLGMLIEACLKGHILVFENENKGVPRFNREKLLGMMKNIMDESETLIKNYPKLDAFTRYLMSRVRTEHEKLYDKLVEMYESTEEKNEPFISYY